MVRVCKDLAEYHRYGGPPGSAGYWSRGDEELVVPAGMTDSLRVLYHEAFHQYIHYAVGDVAPHSWFNEGHGDYFAGHNYAGRKFKAAPFRWRTGTIANALSTKTYVPLRKFLKYTQGEYYANPGLCYAQGWSFVYFLREVERRKIKKYEKYFGLLDRYFDAIKRNVKDVKKNALEGLGPQLPPEPGTGPGAGPDPAGSGDAGLPRIPGLDKPFPGENPEAGRGPRSQRRGEQAFRRDQDECRAQDHRRAERARCGRGPGLRQDRHRSTREGLGGVVEVASGVTSTPGGHRRSYPQMWITAEKPCVEGRRPRHLCMG